MLTGAATLQFLHTGSRQRLAVALTHSAVFKLVVSYASSLTGGSALAQLAMSWLESLV